VSKLNVRAKYQPVRARLAERHADAASVHDPNPRDHAIELHMSVATNNNGSAYSFEHRRQALFRRQTRKAFSFASRGTVAEEDVTQAGDF